MRLVIIEGPDRSGKNTIINRLLDIAPNSVVRHFGKPVGDTPTEQEEYQKQYFAEELQLQEMREKIARTADDMWIFNRSHIGEYVYGPMYRGTSPGSWLWELERSVNMEDAYLIVLSGNPETFAKNGDGESLAEMESSDLVRKVGRIGEEMARFKEATESCTIPDERKRIISVTDANGNYRSRDEIFNEVKELLNL